MYALTHINKYSSEVGGRADVLLKCLTVQCSLPTGPGNMQYPALAIPAAATLYITEVSCDFVVCDKR